MVSNNWPYLACGILKRLITRGHERQKEAECTIKPLCIEKEKIDKKGIENVVLTEIKLCHIVMKESRDIEILFRKDIYDSPCIFSQCEIN